MEIKDVQKVELILIKIFDKICKENGIWYTLKSGSALGAVRYGGIIPWDSDIDVYVKIKDVQNLRNALVKSLPKDMKLHIWDKEPKYPLCFDRLSMAEISHYEACIDIHPLVGAPKREKEQKRFTRICFLSFNFLRCKYVDTKYSQPNNVWIIKFLRLFAIIIPDALIRKWYYYLEKKYDFDNSEYVYIVSSGYGLKECFPKELLLNTKQVLFEDIMLPIPLKSHEYLTALYGDYMTPKRYGYKILK